jgi:hypothetical protein
VGSRDAADEQQGLVREVARLRVHTLPRSGNGGPHRRNEENEEINEEIFPENPTKLSFVSVYFVASIEVVSVIFVNSWITPVWS